MEWITIATDWATKHWTEVCMGWFLADKLVEIIPGTKDDKILAVARKAIKKLVGKDPAALTK